MSSLVRRLQIRMMKRVGYTRNKWIIEARPGVEQRVVNVKRGGEITDRDDNPIGRHWPQFMPSNGLRAGDSIEWSGRRASATAITPSVGLRR